MEKVNNLIVVGASAGGLQAVSELVSGFPDDLDASVFVVLHMGRSSMGDIISYHLQQRTKLTCIIAVEGMKIERGFIYIAPPDHHMMIKNNMIRINKGAYENRWRPSIDVLFRSAAVNIGSRVIGIVLTGMLDDGTSGMWAIKRGGGICMVQEPSEADFADMPNNVISQVKVDYRVSIADMNYIIQDVFFKDDGIIRDVPREVQIEADITERMVCSMDELSQIATHTVFTCPDCGGGLWEVKDEAVHRYRCHTGHVYTEKVLKEKQYEALEESVWISIRMMEERRNLLSTMATHARDAGNNALQVENIKRADAMNVHIERLKQMLIDIDKNV